MKKAIAIFSLLSISMTGYAKTMSCDVNTLVAGQGSVMPVEKKKIQAVVQDQNTLAIGKCPVVQTRGESLSLCAVELDTVGNYAAILSVPSKMPGSGSEGTVSMSYFGTLKSGKGLQELEGGQSGVLVDIQQKLIDANITVPTQVVHGDVGLLDSAVAEGTKKGVLKEGEPVLFSIDSCKMVNN